MPRLAVAGGGRRGVPRACLVGSRPDRDARAGEIERSEVSATRPSGRWRWAHPGRRLKRLDACQAFEAKPLADRVPDVERCSAPHQLWVTRTVFHADDRSVRTTATKLIEDDDESLKAEGTRLERPENRPVSGGSQVQLPVSRARRRRDPPVSQRERRPRRWVTPPPLPVGDAPGNNRIDTSPLGVGSAGRTPAPPKFI
jgi:hypothetical protein